MPPDFFMINNYTYTIIYIMVNMKFTLLWLNILLTLHLTEVIDRMMIYFHVAFEPVLYVNPNVIV